MKPFFLKALVILCVILLGIQFFRIDKTTPSAQPHNDFIQIYSPPKQIAQTLKKACYDCHSFETEYPWYASISPLSWWIQDHIDHGRSHLNFSTWNDYSVSEARHKLEEIQEEISEDQMPLKSYRLGHPEARLSKEERDELITWINALPES